MHHNRYQLKRLGQRATILGATFALAVAAFLPAASVFADGLNPLTERSLLLSSSAPGYINTDGSGNSNDNTTGLSQTLIDKGGPYAQPGTGPNGMKSGETFSFKVSTDSAADSTKAIKGFTLQYCTSAAGKCQAPGNNDGDARVGETAAGKNDGTYNSTSNTGGRYTNEQEVAAGAQKSDLNVHYSGAQIGTDFTIYADLNNNGVVDPGETINSGWSMTASNAEDQSYAATPGNPGYMTGKNNLITLKADSDADAISPVKGSLIKIVFKASTNNYITNPGQGSFFVKMNTYDTADSTKMIPTVPAYNADGVVNNNDIIDGGVTVANVMTDSILITTKVLETMAFSVGTENRDTQTLTGGSVHGTCDAILETNANRLNMGDVNAENSLSVDKAYDAYSYWRLSSNSSGGATVYYSGNTLANTVGDKVAEIGANKAVSTPGTEQFGLAFVGSTYNDNPNIVVDGTFPSNYHLPSLAPFDISTATGAADSQPYNAGEGTIYDTDGSGHTTPGTAKFAFLSSSQTTPVPIAAENTQVISCATAKMRYVANIAADTPAGIYTTKINYLAAPQY